MSYETIATSVDSAKTIFFYEFKMSIRAWTYTNVDTQQITGGYTYIPYAISHSNIQSSGDASQGGVSVKVPGDNIIASFYVASPPSEKISLTIYQGYEGETERKVIWKGRVLAAEWDDDSMATLTCESVFASQQRVGVRRRCQANCPFVLYGTQCGVSSGLWQQSLTATVISGNTITVPGSTGHIDNWYAGGSASWLNSNGIRERRMIKSSNGTTGVMVLSSFPVDLNTTTVMTVLPGCDHTLRGANGCGKFNNKPRYGGQPFMPTKKPFSGSSMY